MTESNLKLNNLTIQMRALQLAVDVNSERVATVVFGQLLRQPLVG